MPSSTYNPDEVRLVVAGREFTGFTGASIEMAVDSCADGFSLSAPFDSNDAALRAAFRPFGYQAVQLYIGDDLMLTGRLDKVAPSSTTGGRVLVAQGRSLTASLVDCGIDGALEFLGLSLSTIARKVASPLGVSIRADNDTDAIDTARAEYGETAYTFLNSLAAPRHLLLNSSYDGKLVISSGKSLVGKPPVANLVEGDAGPGEVSVLSVSADYDGSKRFSVYKAATQFADEPDAVGSSTDAQVKVTRPHLAAVSDLASDPAVTAARLRAEAIVASVGLSVTLSGWRRPDGKRWAERQIVNLTAPGAMVYSRTAFLVAGASFKLDTSEGRTTTLRLVFPETYSGAMPGAIPWA